MKSGSKEYKSKNSGAYGSAVKKSKPVSVGIHGEGVKGAISYEKQLKGMGKK